MLSGAGALRLLEGLALYRTDSHQTIAAQLEAHAEKTPHAPLLYFGDRRYTYSEANALINRHASAYRSLGVGSDDVVALLLENRPEFLWHLYALHKIGAIASLINTNLQADALAHAVRICSPVRIVCGSEVWKQFDAIADDIGPNTRSIVDVDIDAEEPISVPASVWSERLVGRSDANPTTPGPILRKQAAYIYTSGTTGLPKAAIVRHDRFFRAGRVWAFGAFQFQRGDVLYNCLPLYHSNAVLLAASAVVTAGVTMALSRKFSRSRFWSDVRRYDASAIIYIGELCRYLLNAPPSAEDKQHRVRVASGNGLRPDIWREFQQRFGIKHIAEFYGATEGNSITINMLNIFGSVGPSMPGMVLARWDEATNDFVRDHDGRLQRVHAGEPGILLGKIRKRARFEGYQDKQATESKIIRDAFVPGDAYFNTGDLLRRDRLNHLYFVDRVGDTFRWKGENVATSEVQAQLLKWPAVEEANVYGVSIPGTDGRAGMAALALHDGTSFDPDGFAKHVALGLPPYARPIFVRVMHELQKTSTFKLQKNGLQKDGFDPSVVQDPLYFLDSEKKQYVPVTPELFSKIQSGSLQL